MAAEFLEQKHFELRKQHTLDQSEWSKERELLQQKIEQLEIQLVEFEEREQRMKQSQKLLMNEISKVDKSQESKNTHKLLVLILLQSEVSPRRLSCYARLQKS